MLSWRTRRQLAVLLIIALPLVAVVFWTISKFLPATTCFDNRKNQGELDTDCGGPCAPCELQNPKPITTFWTRIVPVRENTFDAAAEIQNTNEVLSSVNVEYEFILLDNFGPIAIRSGKTFLFAQERTHIIEANIKTTHEPTGVEFRILNVDWQFREETKPNLAVERRDYTVETDSGKRKSVVETSISNHTPLGFKQVWVQAVILGQDENLIGVNSAVIENLLSGSSQVIKFIWPEELQGEIVTIEVEPRVNIFDNTVILKP